MQERGPRVWLVSFLGNPLLPVRTSCLCRPLGLRQIARPLGHLTRTMGRRDLHRTRPVVKVKCRIRAYDRAKTFADPAHATTVTGANRPAWTRCPTAQPSSHVTLTAPSTCAAPRWPGESDPCPGLQRRWVDWPTSVGLQTLAPLHRATLPLERAE